MQPRTTVRFLGYAGLLPFVISAFLVLTSASYSGFASITANAYAFGIICFLVGGWWGMGYSADNRHLVLLSNVYFLLAFLVFLFTPAWWPLVASLLLIGAFALEQNRLLFPNLPAYYRTMRAILTLGSGGSMLVIFLSS